MKRNDGRAFNELRKIRITKNYLKNAEGSCLIECGETRVVCTASLEDSVPPFLKNKGAGWVTAEYGMLPCSCETRIRREKAAGSGRTLEIQRLIGRSLRGVIDLDKLGERTIKIDCDVVQADGGTRTASITGGFIALALALMKIRKEGRMDAMPLTDYVAAVSVGIYKGEQLIDLNYAEDSQADMDMNVVMVGKGKFIEVQGTAEKNAFSKAEMDKLLDLAKKGIKELIEIQEKNVEGIEIG
ncbi:MAG: ribonuclease PH [Candidatus Omnitrophica bacterium]|nr:ribonuclease PH [Candidatus Omnitrophota bacterium]